MREKLYLKDFQLYQNAKENQRRNIKKNNPYYDLGQIPSLRMRCEIAGFITHRSRHTGLNTFDRERVLVERIGLFLSEHKGVVSMRDKSPEVWNRELKKWMLENGYPLTYHIKLQTGQEYQAKAKLLCYLENLLKYLEPEDTRPEHEKDIWNLDKLNVPYKVNPVVNYRTINFTQITQDGIREETKRAIYHMIQGEAIGCIKRKVSAMRGFSRYLSEKQPEVNSCRDIDRALIEEYLVYLNSECAARKNIAGVLSCIKTMLEVIGKIYGYTQLVGIFLEGEIPKVIKPLFRAYSDEELIRLNAAIAELDEQIARLMVIHQMLGTRISDTLTLRRGCLYEKDGETIICIKQLKTRPYEKPVSEELAALIRRAEEYTTEKYGETQYIFVNEKDISRPMQYPMVKFKVMVMIEKKDLRDDYGERFGFGAHMFRHTYGRKLTEMHLDDWTIAKLLGHRGLGSLKHYRRMSNQVLAEETREARKKMSEIILANLEGWEEEYEQIRFNGGV